MIDDPFYLIGRRAGERVGPVSSGIKPSTIRAEGGGSTTLQAWGWNAATFGAGAILGWLAKTRRGNR
ncbi:hypothetical protein HAP94_00325 [Acidithiobacillus ferrivorans]|uniref:Uncharacterized protein n=1 Tax=mine drainage metagenome TaxID=410659 RepID=E6QJB2_9ZZZZ|nr:hypothetical protein [Acidithiobacillus ferrivorans]